jgi:hypothetical protein
LNILVITITCGNVIAAKNEKNTAENESDSFTRKLKKIKSPNTDIDQYNRDDFI